MSKMKVEIDEKGSIVLKEIYSGILLETKEGNQIGVCMRDDTFEINVLPKGFQGQWHRVNMQTTTIEKEM